jgi:hypothetical protein
LNNELNNKTYLDWHYEFTLSDFFLYINSIIIINTNISLYLEISLYGVNDHARRLIDLENGC